MFQNKNLHVIATPKLLKHECLAEVDNESCKHLEGKKREARQGKKKFCSVHIVLNLVMTNKWGRMTWVQMQHQKPKCHSGSNNGDIGYLRTETTTEVESEHLVL